MSIKLAAVLWVLACTGLVIFINIFKPKNRSKQNGNQVPL